MRAAIVGSGHIARSHVMNFRRLGVEVVAVVNPNLHHARAFCAEYGIGEAFELFEDLVKLFPDLDFVSICTPTGTHREYSLKALRRDINVYLEKPIERNLRETIDIVEEVERRDASLMVAYNNRYRAGAVRLASLIDEGLFGKIYHFDAVWTRKKGIPGVGSWITDKKKAGGGVVLDLVHMLDLAIFLGRLHDPLYALSSNGVYMMEERFNREGREINRGFCADAETTSYALITYENGVTLSSHTAWTEQMEEDERVYVALLGDKGWARLSWKDGEDILEGETEEGGLIRERWRSDDMGRYEAAKFFVESLERSEKLIPLDSLYTMAAVDAIYRSDSSQRPQKVPRAELTSKSF